MARSAGLVAILGAVAALGVRIVKRREGEQLQALEGLASNEMAEAASRGTVEEEELRRAGLHDRRVHEGFEASNESSEFGRGRNASELVQTASMGMDKMSEELEDLHSSHESGPTSSYGATICETHSLIIGNKCGVVPIHGRKFKSVCDVGRCCYKPTSKCQACMSVHASNYAEYSWNHGHACNDEKPVKCVSEAKAQCGLLEKDGRKFEGVCGVGLCCFLRSHYSTGLDQHGVCLACNASPQYPHRIWAHHSRNTGGAC